MSDSLFDIYQNAESAKALSESLESKYMAEDASATKFLYTQHNLMMDEAISVAVIIDKLPPSWNEFKHGLQHKKEELNLDDEVAWWVDSGATSYVCKDLRWFQVCKSNEDESFVKMGNVVTEPIKGIGRVLLTFTSEKTLCLDNVLYVPMIRKNLVYEIVLNKCGYKQVLESDKYILSRHGSFVGFGYVCNGMIRININYPLVNASACMITSSHSNSLSKSELWHARLGHVHYKRKRDMSKMSLIPAFDMTHESCKTCMLTKITRQPFKGVNRESKVLDRIHSDLCDFHANPGLGHNKYVITFIDDASRYCYVYLLHAKHEALDKFKIYKQEVEIHRQDLIKVSCTDRGERFTSMPKPRGMIQPSSSKIAEDEVEGTDDVPGPSVPRKSTRTRKAKSFGSDFQLYLVEGTRDKTLSHHEYCFIIEEDPRTLSEAMASRDEGIDFFDTYAPVARISTIRLLLALAVIHDLVIYQMNVKTAFLNGGLDEKIYMKQLEGFVMPGHESKVCKLKKSLYGLKQAPKKWHRKFEDVVLSNGFSLNQADKCVYRKFDASGKGVIIYIYVDDMLIFGTDQDQVNKTKEFLSSKFDVKDLGEAEVILGIRIKRGNNGISISQSHYIEKILTKFKFANCSPVYTHVDPTVNTRPDIAFAVRKLNRYTSNPSALHSQALGYSDASWINNMKDHSSTSGWIFLRGGGVISCTSKKQTCITSSTMESEFVDLVAVGNEAELLRNLIYEIPLPVPFEVIKGNICIKSSCNGLVLVTLAKDVNDKMLSYIILWNPLTGDYKTSLTTKPKYYKEFYSRGNVFEMYYNSSEEDCRLLGITYNSNVYIYSWKSDTWKRIKFKDAFQSLPNLFPDNWFAGIYRVVKDARRWRLGEGVNLYTGCVATPVFAATALDEGRELAHADPESWV
nr:zinc finger, CCHC-type [Tanacetum cinerariifolium]